MAYPAAPNFRVATPLAAWWKVVNPFTNQADICQTQGHTFIILLQRKLQDIPLVSSALNNSVTRPDVDGNWGAGTTLALYVAIRDQAELGDQREPLLAAIEQDFNANRRGAPGIAFSPETLRAAAYVLSRDQGLPYEGANRISIHPDTVAPQWNIEPAMDVENRDQIRCVNESSLTEGPPAPPATPNQTPQPQLPAASKGLSTLAMVGIGLGLATVVVVLVAATSSKSGSPPMRALPAGRSTRRLPATRTTTTRYY